MKTKTIKGERIVLRSLDIKLAAVYLRWISDREVIKYLMTQTPITLAKEKQWVLNKLKDKTTLDWTIWVGARPIGNVGLKLSEGGKVVNLGIFIGEKDAWGHGFATETINLLSRYVFTVQKAARLELMVHTENARAVKCYERLGFKNEGIMRDKHFNFITKRLEDVIMMSILKKEYKTNNLKK